MQTSERPPRNIYKTARKVAGLTQERWAEAVGVSVDSIRGYETGAVVPADETVRAMAEISGLSPLAYWHLCNKAPWPRTRCRRWSSFRSPRRWCS